MQKGGQLTLILVFIIVILAIAIGAVTYSYIAQSDTDCDLNGNGIITEKENERCEQTAQEDNCGGTICDEKELDKGSCPQDCNIADNSSGTQSLDTPWSFFSMHVENIDEYDQCFDDIISLADQYNTKLTMLMWPQIRDHILESPEEMVKVQQWIANGHEIGIHAQYCCAENENDKTRGSCLSPGDGEKYSAFVGDHEIKTVHVAPSIIVEEGDSLLGYTGCVDRVPQTALYSGVGRFDGRSSIALKYVMENHLFYELHLKAGYLEPLTTKKGQYESLNPSEIYNFNSHAECDLGIMEEWLQYLSKNDPEGGKRQTQRWLMENVIISNEQYIELDEVFSSTDEQITKCASLVGEKVFADVEWYSATDIYNFGRCLQTETYCYTNETCPTSGEAVGGPKSSTLYVPTRCESRSIDDLDEYKTVSELCQGVDQTSDSGCGDGDCREKDGETVETCPQDCS